MPIYSRKERYKNLRNQITVDSESNINVDASGVGEYAERLDRIEPGIIRGDQNSIDEFNRTLDHLYQVIGNTPYGGTPRPERGARTASYPYEPVQPAEPERTYSHHKSVQSASDASVSFIRPVVNGQAEQAVKEERKSSSEPVKSEEGRKPMTAEDIKNEIEMLLREDSDTAQSNTFEVQDWPETETNRPEVQDIRQDHSEHQDETVNYEDRIQKTQKAIGLILNILIVVLVVILITVVFLVLKNRLGISL